jgi:hypothetical protein
VSGQLVGEVLDAAEAGRLKGLSNGAAWALVTIAEKCHTTTRQGSVRMSRIQAVMGDKSRRTAARAVRELADRRLIQVVKHGYMSHGIGHANVYELAVLVPPKTAQATEDACATLDVASKGNVLVPNPDVLVPNPDVLVPSMDGNHDGIYDGLNDGSTLPRARARGDGRDKALARLDRLNNTARSVDAYRIAEAFSASLPTPIETGLLADIGVQIDKCLDAGIAAANIAAGLKAWTQSDSWSPTQIPRFVHKANNGATLSTADQRVAQAQALKAKFRTNPAQELP